MIDRINGYPKDTVLMTSAGAVVRLEHTPGKKARFPGQSNPEAVYPGTLEFQTEDDI